MIEQKVKQIFSQLNKIHEIDMKNIKQIQSSKYVLNYVSNYKYIKFYSKIPYVNTLINDGFLVSVENLNQLFTKETLNEVTHSLDFISDTILNYERVVFNTYNIYAPKLLVYIPFEGDVHKNSKSFIALDLHTSLWVISDIQELDSVKSNILYKDIPVKVCFEPDLKNISAHIEEGFFDLFSQYNPGSTYDDFVVSLMEHI